MNRFIQNCLEWLSDCYPRKTNAKEDAEPDVMEEGGIFEHILELNRNLQNEEASNIPPMSVQYGQMLYTTTYDTNIKAEEQVQDHLESLSSEEREIINRVMERDRKFQQEMATEVPQISLLSRFNRSTRR